MPRPMNPGSVQSFGGRQCTTVRMLGRPNTWMTWPCSSGFGGVTWSPMIQLNPTLTTLRSPTQPR